MANISYQKLKCMLSVANNYVYLIKKTISLPEFRCKMRYVWQGVIVAISRRICDVKIMANLHYVCQGTKLCVLTAAKPMVVRNCLTYQV